MNKKFFYFFSIIILLIGLLNVENYVWYYFGVFFFLFAFFNFTYVSKSEQSIFPICHLIIGFTIMIGSFINFYDKKTDTYGLEFFKNPIISDNNGYFYPYVGISLFLVILAIVCMFYYGLSHNFRKKKHSLIIVMLLFIVSLLMIAFLPRILIYL